MKSYFKNRYFLNAALSLCWLATAIIGFNGFFKTHELLTVTLFNFQISSVITSILGCITFSLPVISLFVNVRIAKWLLFLSILTYIILIVFDLNRLTPYMVVYLALFSALILLKYDSSILYTALLIIASGLYVFSGLHKLNIGFVTNVAPGLWFHSLPLKYSNTLGYSFALFEIVVGLSLLIPLARKFACILLITMHLIIMWKLSPWKLDWNYIVLPWNLMMMITLAYLFRKSSLSKFKIGSAKTQMIVLGTFFWVLPILSFIIWIPENLSAKMYSGKSKSGYMIFDKQVDQFKRFDQVPEKEKMLISLQEFSMIERGIAIHPEKKIYDEILKNVEKVFPEVDTIYYSHPAKLKERL